MKLGKLIGKLVGYVGARFLGAGMGFLTQIVLARLLPQADVGAVLMGMSAAAFVSLATHGGYNLLAMTQLPKLALHRRNALTSAFHQLVLTDTLMWSVLMFVVLFVASRVFGFSDAQNIALLFGCICSPVSSLMRYNSVIAATDRRIELSYVPDFLVRPALFLLGLLALKSFGVSATPVSVLSVFVAVTCATSLGQAAILGRDGMNVLNVGWPRKALAYRLRARSTSLMIVSALTLAFADIVTLSSAFFLPEDEVAIVGISMRLAAIAGFVLQAGQSFILPDYTEAVMKRDAPKARGILMKFNLLTLATVGAFLVGTLVVGQLVLRLFGTGYVQGWWLLVLFMVGQSIRALGGMNQHILSMEGQQLRAAGACVVTLILLLLAALVLCRHFGFVGMGYAVVLAELVWLLSLGIMADKWAGRRGDLLWLLQSTK